MFTLDDDLHLFAESIFLLYLLLCNKINDIKEDDLCRPRL